MVKKAMQAIPQEIPCFKCEGSTRNKKGLPCKKCKGTGKMNQSVFGPEFAEIYNEEIK